MGDVECVRKCGKEADVSVQIHWHEHNKRGTFHLCRRCKGLVTLGELWKIARSRPGRLPVYDATDDDVE